MHAILSASSDQRDRPRALAVRDDCLDPVYKQLWCDIAQAVIDDYFDNATPQLSVAPIRDLIESARVADDCHQVMDGVDPRDILALALRKGEVSDAQSDLCSPVRRHPSPRLRRTCRRRWRRLTPLPRRRKGQWQWRQLHRLRRRQLHRRRPPPPRPLRRRTLFVPRHNLRRLSRRRTASEIRVHARRSSDYRTVTCVSRSRRKASRRTQCR